MRGGHEIVPLLAFITFGVLVVELLYRYPCVSSRRGDRQERSPPMTASRVNPVDAHTPRWILPFGQVYGPNQLPRLHDVIGMTVVKRQLTDLLGSALSSSRSGRPMLTSGILVCGARGAGKTLLVRAVTGDLGARLVHISARLLIPRSLAASQPAIAAIVRYAQTHAPSVLMIDDLEALILDNHGDWRVRSTAYDLLQELRQRDRGAATGVVATLASEQAVLPMPFFFTDFEPVICVDGPDTTARRQLVKRIIELRNLEAINLDAVVGLTVGMTPAQIINLTQRACGRAQLHNGPYGLVEPAHFRSTLREPMGPRWVDELSLSRGVALDVDAAVHRLANPRASVGILLLGDVGTGKTTVARCLARTSRRRIVSVAGDSFGRGDVVDQRTLRARVDEVIARCPSVLLIDDCRLLASLPASFTPSRRERGPSIDRVNAEIDRALSHDGVSVIATAPKPAMIDRRVRRSGHFAVEIYLSLPDEQARLALLQHHLRTAQLHGVTVEVLAAETVGYTPAQLESLARYAVRAAEHRSIRPLPSQWALGPIVTPLDIWRARQMVFDIAA